MDGRGKLKIMWKSLFLNDFSPYLSYTNSQLSFELCFIYCHSWERATSFAKIQ